MFFSNLYAENLELVAPVALERADGLDKLPKNVFADSNGLESWFVQEKGFQPESKERANAQQRPANRNQRRPAQERNQRQNQQERQMQERQRQQAQPRQQPRQQQRRNPNTNQQRNAPQR